MAIHQQLAAPLAAAPLANIAEEGDLTITRERKVMKPYAAWTGKMDGTNVYSEAELHRWLGALLCFIEAKSTILEPLLREFCVNPGIQNAR